MKERITIAVDETVLDSVDKSRGNVTRSLFINTVVGYGIENNVVVEKISRGVGIVEK